MNENEKLMLEADKTYKKMWDLIVKECKGSLKHTDIFVSIDEYVNAEIAVEAMCNQ